MTSRNSQIKVMHLCGTKWLPFRKVAVVFAYSKFNEYLYSKNVIAEKDHKPLKRILNTLMQKTPTRIEWFIMFPQKYDFLVNTAPPKTLFFSTL